MASVTTAVTPSSSIKSPYSRLFGHHEAFARHLVEETPSPLARVSRRRGHEQNGRMLTDIFQDHVVRGSRSSATRSASSVFASDLLRPPTTTHAALPNAVLGEIDPNNQRLRLPLAAKSSPTPSLKKKKAEQILQQHGSPPGVRVTAGGRIVPSEHSPLCSPRYGYSAIQRNGGLIKFAPGYPPPPKTFPNFAKSLPNGFVAQDPNGKLCQMVDGRFLHIPEVNGIPQLFITAPNVNNLSWNQFHSPSHKDSSPEQSRRETTSRSDAIKSTPGPSIAAQVAALEKHYQKLELERRSLDKAEVLKRNELTGKAYTQLVQKRRELVNRQDELRRSIKTLQERQSNEESTSAAPSARSSPEMQYPSFPASAHFAHMADWGEQNALSQQHATMLLPPGSSDQTLLTPQAFFPSGYPTYLPMQTLVPPVSASIITDSRAGEFGHSNASITGMPPMSTDRARLGFSMVSADENGGGRASLPGSQGLRSALNPMSPIYEPSGSKITTPEKKLPQSLHGQTSQNANPPTEPRSSDHQLLSHESGPSLRCSSASSFATADFFPNNPREYSLKQDSYPLPSVPAWPKTGSGVTMDHCGSEEALAQPELERHNVNWNPTIPDQAFQRGPSDYQSGYKGLLRDVETQTRRSPPLLSPKRDENDEFGQGYNAGLRRAAIGSETGVAYLAGYCKGLLQSASLPNSADEVALFARPVVRLPSNGSSTTSARSINVGSQPPSLATTKAEEGMKANTRPAKEAAASTVGPHDPSTQSFSGRDLGAWAKLKVEQTSDENLKVKLSAPDDIKTYAGQLYQHDLSKMQDVVYGPGATHDEDHMDTLAGADDEMNIEHRAFSAQTQPAHNTQSSQLQRIYPGLRVLSSPAMDWKSSTSMAHVAGMATGYFAQFDGTASKPISRNFAAPGDSGTVITRFKEATMSEEGHAPYPTKTTASSSPKKSISPAKAKFAAIAGKAGIKVRTDRPTSKESNDMEPMSPQERRRWRDVWKKRNTTID
ncbi:hypothetical protein ANO11243_031300 [Dothideomycetidae sp. 11243]|nr:hypothetical protein ANO11243_031300 [fungal sp. No.11243]